MSASQLRIYDYPGGVWLKILRLHFLCPDSRIALLRQTHLFPCPLCCLCLCWEQFWTGEMQHQSPRFLHQVLETGKRHAKKKLRTRESNVHLSRIERSDLISRNRLSWLHCAQFNTVNEDCIKFKLDQCHLCNYACYILVFNPVLNIHSVVKAK